MSKIIIRMSLFFCLMGVLLSGCSFDTKGVSVDAVFVDSIEIDMNVDAGVDAVIVDSNLEASVDLQGEVIAVMQDTGIYEGFIPIDTNSVDTATYDANSSE